MYITLFYYKVVCLRNHLVTKKEKKEERGLKSCCVYLKIFHGGWNHPIQITNSFFGSQTVSDFIHGRSKNYYLKSQDATKVQLVHLLFVE